MKRHLDDELSELNKLILEMAYLVETAINNSIEALKTQDKEKAKAIISDDAKIDELEIIVEELCITLLSLFQPQAKDLRFITNAIKINAELERIADLAVDIAQRVLELKDQVPTEILKDILKLAEVSKNMLRGAISSFINHNTELARSIILKDKEADNLRDLIQNKLIYEYILKDPLLASNAISLLLVARHLERVSDHTTNIAEDVIYCFEAKIVRYHFEKL